MIKAIELKGFKCFKDKTCIPLRTVTVLYGKNGRGKSSVAQSVLLLAQTMRKNNSLDYLILNDGYVNQGYFDELVNKDSEQKSFEIELESEFGESVKVVYERMNDRPQLGMLVSQIVNGKETFEEMSASNDVSAHEDDAQTLSAGVTSDIAILQGLKDTMYVSADRIGPVNDAQYTYPQKDVPLSPTGKNIINLIAEQNAGFVADLERNLSNVLSGASLSIEYTQDKIELGLNSSDGSSTMRPINVGFGYSYVLPVIVAAMLAKPGCLVIVENPEAHLHPGAQSRLANFLITQSEKKKFQLILETHSDHVINGLRIAAKNGSINFSDTIILHFSHAEDSVRPVIQEIRCDKNGNLSDYPDDFMDEWTKQLLKLV
jgi:predicted ATPase